MSIEQTDIESASAAKNPAGRVSLAEIEAYIVAKDFSLLGDMLEETSSILARTAYASVKTVTICVLVMRNGFVVIGKAAPLDPENFNAALGRKFAYEDAIRQLWPLMAFGRSYAAMG